MELDWALVPPITKLLYADDVLLFCAAKISEVQVLMGCVKKFWDWSGLSISKDKSDLFASKGVCYPNINLRGGVI